MGPSNDLHATVQELDVEVAVLTERIKHRDDALKLQAAEYERRLDALNHEHARADEALQTYIPREVFERALKEYDAWRREVDEDRIALRARNSTYTSVIALALAMASIAVEIWRVLHI